MKCSRCQNDKAEIQYHSGAYAGRYCDPCFKQAFNAVESDPDGADEYYSREDDEPNPSDWRRYRHAEGGYHE